MTKMAAKPPHCFATVTPFNEAFKKPAVDASKPATASDNRSKNSYTASVLLYSAFAITSNMAL
jgi:hypothetical protein